MLSHQHQQKIIVELLKRKENAICADCNSKSPCWASLDFGVFVCLNCSGAHRALGPSITRVKSSKLDSWNNDWVSKMQTGNSILNQYWENGLSGSSTSIKPNTNSCLDSIIVFVKNKYVKKLYVHPTKSLDEVIKEHRLKTKSNEKIIPFQAMKHPKLAKFNKALTTNENIIVSKQQNKKTNESAFSVFDQFGKIDTSKPVKQAKQQNLISFEQQNQKSIVKSNISFDDFEFIEHKVKPKQQKYSKQQFMSLGGQSQKKATTQINFDAFAKLHTNNESQNNLYSNMNKNQNLKPNHQQQQKHIYSLHTHQHYPKNQFSTTNNGFIIHPNNEYSIQHKAHITKHYSIGLDKNFDFDANFLSKPQLQKPSPINSNITLQANINLNMTGQESTPAPRSWIDDWK